MLELIVLGTKGTACQIATIAEACGYHIIGYVGIGDVGTKIGTSHILGDDEWLLAQPAMFGLALGVGHPALRAKLHAKYRDYGFPNIIDPTAVMRDGGRNVLGIGNTISVGGLFACDVVVGNCNFINSGVVIGHNAVIGDYNVINPLSSIAGYATVGNRVLIGAGARILEGLRVGDGAKVGAGAVVTKDVEPGMTVVGIPARPLKC